MKTCIQHKWSYCCSYIAEQTDAAWQLASSVLEGAALGKALGHVIRALAEACVRAQHQALAGTDSSRDAAGFPASPAGTKDARDIT